MHSLMHCESASLDERFVASRTFVRSFIRMNSFMSAQVRSSSESLHNQKLANSRFLIRVIGDIPLCSQGGRRERGVAGGDCPSCRGELGRLVPFDNIGIGLRLKRCDN